MRNSNVKFGRSGRTFAILLAGVMAVTGVLGALYGGMATGEDGSAYADEIVPVTTNISQSDVSDTALDMNALAADGSKAWIKNHGYSGIDMLNSVVQANDGSYVAVGKVISYSSNLPGYKGGEDFIIAKFDANGNKVWIKNYGGSDSDVFNSVVKASDGSYVAVGRSASNGGDLPGNKGGNDFIIAKFDANGNKVWIKNYGGSGSEQLISVVRTNDGSYVAVGNSSSNDGDVPGNKGGDDFIIAKFDANGNKMWIKSYGGSGADDFSSVVQAGNGSYVAVGGSTSKSGDVSGNNGKYDFIIAKFDDSGNKVWIKNYGGSKREMFNSVVQSVDGSYVAVGLSRSNDGDVPSNKGKADFIIAKFNASGNKVWIKNYGGSDSEYVTEVETDIECFSSVVQTKDGSYVAVGTSSSNNGDVPGNKGSTDLIIAKFNASGNKVWIKNYGGSDQDYFKSVVRAGDGSYAAAGYSYSNGGDVPGNIGYCDFIIAKFNVNEKVSSSNPSKGSTSKVKTYTVTFKNGKKTVKKLKVKAGKRIKKIPTVKKNGYKFKGWYNSKGKKLTKKTKISKNTVYRAKWVKK